MSRDSLVVRTSGVSLSWYCEAAIESNYSTTISPPACQTPRQIMVVGDAVDHFVTPSNEPSTIPPCLLATSEVFLDVGRLGYNSDQERQYSKAFETTSP